MSEVKEILRFKRECDCWLCPECDTENSMMHGKCALCGCGRASAGVILKKWTEADDMPPIILNNKTEEKQKAPVYKTTEKDFKASSPEEEKGKNNLKWIAIAIIIFLFLAFCASIGEINALELADDNLESYTEVYEIYDDSYEITQRGLRNDL